MPRGSHEKDNACLILSSVAAVAKNSADDVCTEDLVNQLRCEGAEPAYLDDQLYLRPTNWNQIHQLSKHWLYLLTYLFRHEKEDQNGSDR